MYLSLPRDVATSPDISPADIYEATVIVRQVNKGVRPHQVAFNDQIPSGRRPMVGPGAGRRPAPPPGSATGRLPPPPPGYIVARPADARFVRPRPLLHRINPGRDDPKHKSLRPTIPTRTPRTRGRGLRRKKVERGSAKKQTPFDSYKVPKTRARTPSRTYVFPKASSSDDEYQVPTGHKEKVKNLWTIWCEENGS